LAKGSPVE